MLVLAPAACIISGIALSDSFNILTRSIKVQLGNLLSGASVVCPLFFIGYVSQVTFLGNPRFPV